MEANFSDYINDAVRVLVLLNAVKDRKSIKVTEHKIKLYDYYLKFPCTMLSDDLPTPQQWNFDEYYAFFHWQPDLIRYRQSLNYLQAKGLIEKALEDNLIVYRITDLGIAALNDGINPRIQGIMLSGVAMAKDLEIAQKIAGSRIRHLVKDDVLQLPELVLEAISAYYTSVKRVSDNIDLTKKFSFKLFARKPKITLISHYVLDDNFLFDENWKVETRVRSGEDAKKIETITMSTKQTIVTEAISNIHTDFSLDINQLKKILTTHFEAKMSDELQEAYEYRSQKEHTYKLPEIPSSPTEDHPIEVRYEYNFIYRRVRAHLSVDCHTCGITNYEDFDVYVPTGRIVWRQVAHYAIGGTRITPL